MLDQNDIQIIKELLNESIAASEERMRADIKASEERQDQKMRLLIENYFDPKFKILAEGHETLLQTLSPRSRVDALEEEVGFLKTVVSALSKEVSELKKAI